MKFLDIQVLIRNGHADLVSVMTDMPSPIPNGGDQTLYFTFRAQAGTGVAYCEKHFPGVKLEILDT